MGQVIPLYHPADIIRKRELRALLVLQRRHDEAIRNVRTRLTAGATLEACNLHFELGAGRVLEHLSSSSP